MTNLSDFLVDMRDSERKVMVTENQLRRFAIQNRELGELVTQQQAKIDYLLHKINCLEAKANVIETIDLFV